MYKIYNKSYYNAVYTHYGIFCYRNVLKLKKTKDDEQITTAFEL